MSTARVLLVLCGLLAISACGSANSMQPANGDQAAPATPPPIEAIDGPAPDTFWPSPPDDASTGSTYMCLGDEGQTAGEDTCKPTPAQVEKMDRLEKEIEQATRPAKGSEPRAIALLRLQDRGPKSRVLLIAWRNESDKLCLGSDEEDDEGGSGGGAFGPCLPEGRCHEICLDFSGTGSGRGTLYLLSGVLASRADRLRMTLDDGRIVTYDLAGPLVPGLPDYRVFMLDLGRGLYERLELSQGEKVIAEERRSRAEIKMMRCQEDFPPVLPFSDSRSRRGNGPLAECLDRAKSD
jgi:hypothetical protein